MDSFSLVARRMFVFALLTVLPLVVSGVIQGDVKGDKFSNAEKQKILDIHNELRAKVARGEEGGQPQAADMIALVSSINSYFAQVVFAQKVP